MERMKEKFKFGNGIIVYGVIAVAIVALILWIITTYIKDADENMMKMGIAIVPILIMFSFFAKFLTEQEMN